MNFRSIRWQLPLSYAAIAAIAALALGIVLLSALRSYYAGEERQYMERNARAFSDVIGEALVRDASVDELNAQLSQMSFFTKSRLQLLDGAGNVLADSGPVGEAYVSFTDISLDPFAAEFEASGVVTGSVSPLTITILRPGTIEVISEGGLAEPPVAWIETFDPFGWGIFSQDEDISFEVGAGGPLFADEDGQISTVLPVTDTFFGFDLSARPRRPLAGRRSAEHVLVDIVDLDNNVLGALNIFDGPAYGTDIVDRVASGWITASAIAVAVAGIIGWGVSMRITEPMRSLAETTATMAEGDLSARATIQRKDEFGALARSFNAMADRIENTIMTLRRFVADAAHEIHTPLTALRTNLELLEDTKDQPASQRAIDQLKRLESLADDLLDLSRIEASRDAADLEAIDLTSLLRESSEIYASRAEQVDLDFDLKLPDTPVVVRGQRHQLQRLFSNLFDNAIKFTPGGGRVTVRLSQSKGRIEAVIDDTGIGIPPADLPDLFKRFKRGRNATNYGGSGLGLAIVKAIVDAHGGGVRAESDGPGTTIVVSLPTAAE